MIARLTKLQKYALRAEWFDVAQILSNQLTELRKTERERSWPLGRCIWCQIDGNRLREAVAYDPGGGPAMCAPHFNEYFEGIPSDG